MLTRHTRQSGLGASNKGFQMLQGLGWQPGQALGKDGQGIAAPIEARTVARGAGLGSAPTYNPEGINSYTDHVRAVTRARYEQL